jgi:hypothetical protein
LTSPWLATGWQRRFLPELNERCQQEIENINNAPFQNAAAPSLTNLCLVRLGQTGKNQHWDVGGAIIFSKIGALRGHSTLAATYRHN